jgi:hypothetical protein
MLQKIGAGSWCIQAMAFPIPFTPFTHNFWALADADGNIADQIHGLAVDPETGQTIALGNSTHLLQVVHDPTIAWSLQPGQPVAVCATGHRAEISLRWQSALNAIPAINSLKLPYPNLWQHTYKKNSNTVFHTIGRIMGFATPPRLLPTWAPGIRLIISQTIIDQYAYKPVFSS